MKIFAIAIRLHLTLVILTFGIVSPAIGAEETNTLSAGTPAEAGMSPAILNGALGIYKEAVARGDIVGAVVLVARHGKVVLHEALGWRDKEKRLPMEKNTMFHMASNTKPVIAAAVARLVEDDSLGYSDLVRDYIPEWDNYRAGLIKIEHLLSHTSGLRINTLFLPPASENTSLQRAAARFGSIGAVVTPGASYSYNNPGYNTLGALIEIASGVLLEDFLDTTIYSPLGMLDTYNFRAGHQLEGKLERMGPVYYKRNKDGHWIPGTPTTIPFARGSGGMVSTTWDYAVFCQMILNGGIYEGKRLLQSESVALMTSAKVKTSNGAYGYGWSLVDGIARHGGSDGTNAWIDFEHGIIGLVFTQTPRGRPPIDRFRQLVKLAIDP
ncbi:MAG: class A beta-lactamase-related serine hydrolase [Calditrichaeota bacterium]|nr:MAG: class A beta-lactamase-related serine hydrolase [Calditrichota bacterium]